MSVIREKLREAYELGKRHEREMVVGCLRAIGYAKAAEAIEVGVHRPIENVPAESQAVDDDKRAAVSPCLIAPEERALRAVDALIFDISDRRGLKREWCQIDADVQQEIRATWEKIIKSAYEADNDKRYMDLVEVLKSAVDARISINPAALLTLLEKT
jgi:hypothetical protein